jgi:hypothetical protein
MNTLGDNTYGLLEEAYTWVVKKRLTWVAKKRYAYYFKVYDYVV